MAGFFSRRDEDTENISDTENEERESEDEEQQSAVEAEALHLHLQAIVEDKLFYVTRLSPFRATFAIWFIQKTYLP